MAAAAAISPTAPLPIISTVLSSSISASSAAVKPVAIMSQAISADSIERLSGICERFISAIGTLKRSAHIPSMFRPSLDAEKGMPLCPAISPGSGMTAETATRSPGLKSFTPDPASSTSAIPSCPSTRFSRLGPAPENTVCTSEEQGDRYTGLRIAANVSSLHEPLSTASGSSFFSTIPFLLKT